MGVGSFRASWATPHGIRWEWEPLGKEQDFQEYRLVTGKSESDVRERTAAAQVWKSDQNPELGVFTLRRTGDEELVRHTSTDGLEVDTIYYAELEVVDTGGCIARSPNVAGKRTTDAAPRVVIMHDTPVGNWGQLIHTTVGCYGATTGCWGASFDCGGSES